MGFCFDCNKEKENWWKSLDIFENWEMLQVNFNDKES